MQSFFVSSCKRPESKGPCGCLFLLLLCVLLQRLFMKAYTRVLQGHIGLATSTFPDGTPGFMIDAFARRHLWDAGLDYQHGTGHGVGAALNVHEGPHVSLACLAGKLPSCYHHQRTRMDALFSFGVTLLEALLCCDYVLDYCAVQTSACRANRFLTRRG